ncbi:MAG: hypothetical protein HUJ70_07520 [Pseudobutyrivibrio sp.]|nr:hypothetical protein [Pseudobutyrivibrio sp.]
MANQQFSVENETAQLYHILGEKAAKKHKDILPLLLFFMYRMDNIGLQGVFPHDGYYPAMETLPLKLSAKVSYGLYSQRSRKKIKPAADKPVYFISDNLLLSQRYNAFMEQVFEKYDVVGSFTAADCHLKEMPAENELDKKRDAAKCIPMGKSIASDTTKQYAQETFLKLEELRAKSSTFEDAAPASAKVLLEGLEKHVKADIKRAAKNFSKFNIQSYLCNNIYGLREYICIEAARSLGIPTLHLQHAVDYVWDPSRLYEFYHNADEWLFWCEDDRLYNEQYDRPLVTLGKKDYTTRVVGSPELIYEDVLKDIERFEPKKLITCLVPSFEDLYRSLCPDAPLEEKLQVAEDTKREMFEKLVELADRHQVKIYLRYHPDEMAETMERDADFIKSHDCFILLDGSRENMKRCLSESLVMIASGSALFLADTYGCMAYNLNFSGKPTTLKDTDSLKTINIEDIPNIQVPENRGPIKKENCADVGKLFG